MRTNGCRSPLSSSTLPRCFLIFSKHILPLFKLTDNYSLAFVDNYEIALKEKNVEKEEHDYPKQSTESVIADYGKGHAIPTTGRQAPYHIGQYLMPFLIHESITEDFAVTSDGRELRSLLRKHRTTDLGMRKVWMESLGQPNCKVS
eukprot:Gb_30062 [translate_table: standard]